MCQVVSEALNSFASCLYVYMPQNHVLFTKQSIKMQLGTAPDIQERPFFPAYSQELVNLSRHKRNPINNTIATILFAQQPIPAHADTSWKSWGQNDDGIT